MSFKKQLILGVGVNDLEEPISKGNKNEKVYQVWKDMLKRCYSHKSLSHRPTYSQCSVDNAWHKLSSFKKWFDENYKEDYVLDKDLLSKGNKIYCADFCAFIPKKLNSFLLEREKSRGDFLIGVTLDKREKRGNPYIAQCGNPFENKNKRLGYFETPEEAHEAWRSYKYTLALQFLEEYPDLQDSVKAALLLRYSKV